MNTSYRELSSSDIEQLVAQGCWAEDWATVRVHPACDLSRLQRVDFHGCVEIGLTSSVHNVDGVGKPCGIYNACIANCSVGNNVRIANVGSGIVNCAIENGALIENVACIVADTEATFGNGVEVEAVNEAGGREIKILNDLTAQTAYLQAMLRHDVTFTEALFRLVSAKIASEKKTRARVGANSRILHCGALRNVSIGPAACIQGARLLEDGTVNSCAEHPTYVGADVQARSFILSEGATVEGGAILEKVFVGQGAQVGKQFSAQNSLFFANSECFHGEACSVFGGPYTVTHHKSTLLIAGLFSFYNAGSGTNQSNHMYKLGPVHQGILERGCKTGSFSYVLLESHIGAFSVVIGKHLTNINTPNLPFSYIHTVGEDSKIIPGMNLFSIGTVRDGEKWPKRDRRKCPMRRDLIVFDVFSPYTVEKMRRGRDELQALSDRVPKTQEHVNYGGLHVSRLLLRKGAKYYATAITRYVLDKVLSRLHAALCETAEWSSAVSSLRSAGDLRDATQWTDVCGLITPCERLTCLMERVSGGEVESYDTLLAELQEMLDRYAADEWEYVCAVYAQEKGVPVHAITREQAVNDLEEWRSAAVVLHAMTLEDSKKEFGAFAHIGYGLDQPEDSAARDFATVRGTIETNSVIRKMGEEGEALQQRYAQLKELLTTF